jgi:2-keto-3-deoxy-6-phosphogluconate aldolase
MFPGIALCPTGGLTLENFRDYLAAGDRGRVVAQARRSLG